MSRREARLEHLLRRAGFGASPEDLAFFGEMGVNGAIDFLLDVGGPADDVDGKIGKPGWVGVTTRAGQFTPNTVINDARQRWLFRMVHSDRPLQEKMTLFWHNHFATAYSKLAGTFGAEHGTRMIAAVPSEDAGKVEGQVELLRRHALGNFRDLLIAVSKDPAMIVWLDGRTNVRGRPQENFARELMELFSLGVGFHTEQDVYAGARVFTGWNIRGVGGGGTDPAFHYEFIFNGAQHDTDPKTFSFPIFGDGNRTIPARSSADGLQDGIDLITAVVRHPETARRLARKLYGFFVSELHAPDPALVDDLAAVYFASNYDMRAVVKRLLTSEQFQDPDNYFSRYSWPVEYVVRAIKEVGWTGFSVNDAMTPLTNMGQQLYEPPDVNGWELGPGWFSTGAMLARMNFASQLAGNQRFNLRDGVRGKARSAEGLTAYLLDRATPKPFDDQPYNELLDYARAGGAWTGSDAQLTAKSAGLVHLIVGSSEYQFN